MENLNNIGETLLEELNQPTQDVVKEMSILSEKQSKLSKQSKQPQQSLEHK